MSEGRKVTLPRFKAFICEIVVTHREPTLLRSADMHKLQLTTDRSVNIVLPPEPGSNVTYHSTSVRSSFINDNFTLALWNTNHHGKNKREVVLGGS